MHFPRRLLKLNLLLKAETLHSLPQYLDFTLVLMAAPTKRKLLRINKTKMTAEAVAAALAVGTTLSRRRSRSSW